MNQMRTAHSNDKSTTIGTFNETQWEDLTTRIAYAFSFDIKQLERIRENKVLKLVAALPYLAECNEPERIALSHMATFVLAGHPAAKDVFAHQFQDSVDLSQRLERISHFDGGNQDILDWGMKLLTVAMINDHIHDANSDMIENKMNPVNAGHWDGEDLKNRLMAEIDAFGNEQLAVWAIDVGTQGYWKY